MTQYGAYSKRQIYSTEEMKELVEYARIRGVKIIPEFDAPAHVGETGKQFWIHISNHIIVLTFLHDALNR